MQFVKTWGHEIAVILIAIWAAIGKAGQDGLINLARTELSHWPKAAAAAAIISLLVARYRSAPNALPK